MVRYSRGGISWNKVLFIVHCHDLIKLDVLAVLSPHTLCRQLYSFSSLNECCVASIWRYHREPFFYVIKEFFMAHRIFMMCQTSSLTEFDSCQGAKDQERSHSILGKKPRKKEMKNGSFCQVFTMPVSAVYTRRTCPIRELCRLCPYQCVYGAK